MIAVIYDFSDTTCHIEVATPACYAVGMRYLPILLICLGCVKPSQESEHPAKMLSTRELLDCPHVITAGVAPAKSPKRQILHVLNWHFVDREAYEADDGEDWEAFLDSVEKVQSEQVDLLQHLKDAHGINEVYLEGMTDADVEGYRTLAEALAGWKAPIGDDAMSEFLRRQYREDKLLLGAAVQVEGLEVLPSEDPEAMEAANPIKDWKVQFDEEANERREGAIVRNVLASESPVVVLVLGGGHDLSNSVEAIGGGAVEYVRVQVKAHRKAAGE